MARQRTISVCSSCGHQEPRPLGRCPGCGEWNSMSEQAVADPAPAGKGGGTARKVARGQAPTTAAAARKLSDHDPGEVPRIVTGIGELDRVLGGGLVPGSVVLLAAAPGAGKSTLCSQALDALAGQGRRTVYVAGEESGEQVRLRTTRMGLRHDEKIDFSTETEIGQVCALIGSGYDVAVIDSLQTLHDAELNGAAGSTTVIKEVGEAIRRTAKSSGVAVILIGHVTKEGTIAGPRHLEHMADANIELTADLAADTRMLTAIKNRFGSTNEIGVFRMTAGGMEEVSDPASLFLQGHDDAAAGAAVCPVMQGNRPVLVEVQALARPVPNPGVPGRRSALGIDRNRLDTMLAICDEHAGERLKLYGYDVFLEVSGGIRIEERAADLAICLAIISAVTGRPLRKNAAVFGELSLRGQLRPVAQMDRRAAEARARGRDRLFVPASATLKGAARVRSLRDAVREALLPASDGLPAAA